MSRFDEDLLHVIADQVDADADEAWKDLKNARRDVDTAMMLERLLDDPHAGKDLASLIVARGTSAAQVIDEEDLEARSEEVNRVFNAWIDGFVIATRYAADQAKPKPG